MSKIKIQKLILILALTVVFSITATVVFADDSPPMGGATNWDADGVEWQMYDTGGSGGSEHGFWTYWMNGTDSNFTVGPGLQTSGDAPGNRCPNGQEFSCSAAQETGQDVYEGASALSEQMDRIIAVGVETFGLETYGPVHIWFDRQTLEARDRFQYSNPTGGPCQGLTYTQVWNLGHSGLPANRDLSGGETWSYDEITDPADTAWGDSDDNCCVDAGNRDETISVSVSSGTSQVTVNGMTFDCYIVTKDSDERGNVYDYWDEDGALACSVKTVDEISFDNTNTLELVYHDWPGAPVIKTCDISGADKTEFASGDNVYVTGHWMTLNHANSLTPDVTYDIWVGEGAPSVPTTLSGWGSDTGIDADVGPDGGDNVPGTFGPIDLGTVSSLGLFGEDCYVVLDDDDGIYNGDTNTFELSGVTWTAQEYALGDSADDDGISNNGSPFVVVGPLIDVDIYINLQGDNRPYPAEWQVPIDIGFFPANSGTLVMSGSAAADYWFEGTTSGAITASGTRAYFKCPVPVAPGAYDITVDSITTLMNVKRNVGIW